MSKTDLVLFTFPNRGLFPERNNSFYFTCSQKKRQINENISTFPPSAENESSRAAEQQADDINLLSKRNQSVEIQVVVMMLG